VAIAVPIAARNPTNPDMNQPPPDFFAADRAALLRLRSPFLLRAAFHPADIRRPVLSSAQSRARAPARLIRPGLFLSEVELGVLPHLFFGMLPPVVESEPRPHRDPPPRRELLPPRGVVPPLAPRDAAPLPSRPPPLPPERGEEPPRPNRPPPLVRPPPMRGNQNRLHWCGLGRGPCAAPCRPHRLGVRRHGRTVSHWFGVGRFQYAAWCRAP